jgi:RNA polymerase sigma-70 factor (ECF subfamily)
MPATLALLPECSTHANNSRSGSTPTSCLSHGGYSFLDRLRRRDADACEDFVRTYTPRMLAVARRLTRCEHAAADAVQEALLSAFNSLDAFHGQSQFWTWLYRIVVNSCLMQLRSSGRRPALSLEALGHDSNGLDREGSSIPDSSAPPLELLARDEVRAQVRECIRQLPTSYRTILQLRDIEEFDTDETAGILGISRSAVKTRLHRARIALRMLLEPAIAEQCC